MLKSIVNILLMVDSAASKMLAACSSLADTVDVLEARRRFSLVVNELKRTYLFTVFTRMSVFREGLGA